MESENENPRLDEQGKLRRWVSNLQLESWQLELLITGFSIFLLASSLEQYDEFRRAIVFDKLSPGSNASNPLFALSAVSLLDTIPWALRFFLINLLVHLLLRGFWIGIVGLSSVSSVIDFDKLKLKGPFRKYIPQKVRSLDQLILYLDKVSSVIFAYTYLLVFSILSVMIVFVIMIAMFGLILTLSSLSFQGSIVIAIINTVVTVGLLLYIVCALLYFIDSLFFSTFKKSRWFSSVFYYIYKVFSFISLSFIYRSIYYHLITNYKKKQIIVVGLVLLALFISWSSFTGWNTHKFFPTRSGTTQYIVQNDFYDDIRGDKYINDLSIPSKYIKNGFLEVFIHYDPKYNEVMRYRCPESEHLDNSVSFSKAMKAGMAASMDTTKALGEFLPDNSNYNDRVKASIECLTQLFKISIDDQEIESLDLSFYTHPSKGERGFLLVLDISHLERGKHNLEVQELKFTGLPFMQEITEERLEFDKMARLPFWTY